MPAVLHSISTDNIPVEINSSGIYETDPDTRQKLFVGTVGVIRDIRERAKAEKELRKAYNEVKTINKELEAFSYSVSHDLRAPLRSIDGFSAALLEDYVDVLDEQGKNYLQRVRAATQRMGKLIDDMLMLSRVTRSKMKYEQINLSHLAQTIINELREEEPQRNVKAVIEKDLLVNGDISLLRIMLGNLLHNAWKFTGNNPTARIEFQTIEQEGKQVYLIRDNGIGFEMTYSDKLFGAFQRLHPEDEFPGTGIGLATVQRIINRHGGRVWAEGQLGKGATFYFTLESD
jgi:light-regulated signal transduction histidine kinase (bacteriophytochrome)